MIRNKYLAYTKYYLKKRIPFFRSQHSRYELKPDANYFQLTGLPRSGTTILSSLIDNHPKAYCLIEPFFSFDHDGFIKYTIDSKENFFLSAPHKLLSFFKRKATASRIGFKETFRADNRNFLTQNLEKGISTIAIIRDPRAIFYSIATRFEQSQLRPPTVNYTDEWNDFYTWAKQPGILLVKYEDLISSSESVLQLVLNYLDLDFQQAMLKVKPKSGGGDLKAQESTKLHTEPLEKHKQLPVEYSRFIEENCQNGMKELFYL